MAHAGDDGFVLRVAADERDLNYGAFVEAANRAVSNSRLQIRIRAYPGPPLHDQDPPCMNFMDRVLAGDAPDSDGRIMRVAVTGATFHRKNLSLASAN